MANHSAVRIAFIDVGQGDTIVVSVPETHEAVIVDCVDAEAVISYLEKYDIRHIRGLMISHLHLDHYKDVIKLALNAKSELNLICEQLYFYLPKVSKEIWERIQNDEDGHSDDSSDEKFSKRRFKDALTELRRWAQVHREKFHSLTKEPNRVLPLPGIVELIHPWEVDIYELIGKSLNDISAVLRINGNGTSAMLTGDLEPAGWACLKKTETHLSADVLKFPHHGAWKNSDPNDLLNTVSPTVVVISVGTDGIKYDHPNPHVLKTLGNHSEICVLCTQATPKCMGKNHPKQKDLINCFKEHQRETDSFFSEQKGCPCAGTVIVELGSVVSIIQPDLKFHRDQIIKSHYPNHRC